MWLVRRWLDRLDLFRCYQRLDGVGLWVVPVKVEAARQIARDTASAENIDIDEIGAQTLAKVGLAKVAPPCNGDAVVGDQYLVVHAALHLVDIFQV